MSHPLSGETLHILNQGPNNSNCLERCLKSLGKTDTLLLIENGVYWALPAYESKLVSVEDRLLVLSSDADARGITLTETPCPRPLISDEDFVQLCVTHTNVVSWF